MDGPNLKLASQETVLTDDADREPTKEEILDDIRQGLRDVMAGEEGMPAREAIEALRHRVYGDADDSRASHGPGG